MSKDITLLREIYLGDAPELKVSTKVFLKIYFQNFFIPLTQWIKVGRGGKYMEQKEQKEICIFQNAWQQNLLNF